MRASVCLCVGQYFFMLIQLAWARHTGRMCDGDEASHGLLECKSRRMPTTESEYHVGSTLRFNFCPASGKVLMEMLGFKRSININCRMQGETS